eukprot:CAMPEP_0179067474 /NCGR_PEP_ID=MMETSP0796-20121207/29506_1 /TAXON_ID=73915 /ORGANISM="Pyrodinium bahamense, Strain pbaha01" /LENGTH=370 /DNA_ID=CAMNT_0020764501 /DNA_START=1 /DNA_END=1113 /DNA_ORIENTATION=+
MRRQTRMTMAPEMAALPRAVRCRVPLVIGAMSVLGWPMVSRGPLPRGGSADFLAWRERWPCRGPRRRCEQLRPSEFGRGRGPRAAGPTSKSADSGALSLPVDALQAFLDYAERQLEADIKQQQEFSKSYTEAGVKYSRLRSATIRRTRKLRDTTTSMAAAVEAVRELATSDSPNKARDIGRILQKVSRQVGRYQAVYDRTEGIYREVCSDVDGLVQQAGQRMLKMESEQKSQTELAKLAGFLGLVCLPVAIATEAPVLAALSLAGGAVAQTVSDSADKYGDLSKFYSRVREALGLVLVKIQEERDKLGNVRESLEDAAAQLEEAQIDLEDEEWSSLASATADVRRALANVATDCDEFLAGALPDQLLLES